MMVVEMLHKDVEEGEEVPGNSRKARRWTVVTCLSSHPTVRNAVPGSGTDKVSRMTWILWLQRNGVSHLECNANWKWSKTKSSWSLNTFQSYPMFDMACACRAQGLFSPTVTQPVGYPVAYWKLPTSVSRQLTARVLVLRYVGLQVPRAR